MFKDISNGALPAAVHPKDPGISLRSLSTGDSRCCGRRTFSQSRRNSLYPEEEAGSSFVPSQVQLENEVWKILVRRVTEQEASTWDASRGDCGDLFVPSRVQLSTWNSGKHSSAVHSRHEIPRCLVVILGLSNSLPETIATGQHTRDIVQSERGYRYLATKPVVLHTL